MDKQIITIVKELSKFYKIDFASILAFISVETGGLGFDKTTGKILIQFEPSWFKRKAPYAPSGKWSVNTVDVQSKEWLAFNDAFSKNKTAAMESTSIGLGQIMGFHYKRLGYNTVDEMWDDAKKGIDKQISQIFKFINTDPKLKMSLENKYWSTVAVLYNGAGYKELAKKYGREPYDISLEKAYNKYKDL